MKYFNAMTKSNIDHSTAPEYFLAHDRLRSCLCCPVNTSCSYRVKITFYAALRNISLNVIRRNDYIESEPCFKISSLACLIRQARLRYCDTRVQSSFNCRWVFTKEYIRKCNALRWICSNSLCRGIVCRFRDAHSNNNEWKMPTLLVMRASAKNCAPRSPIWFWCKYRTVRVYGENESGVIEVDVLLYKNFLYSVFVGTDILIHKKN